MNVTTAIAARTVLMATTERVSTAPGIDGLELILMDYVAMDSPPPAHDDLDVAE
jgi:hypothetical protein